MRTGRGAFETPCFMPVGTRAAVRAVTPEDVAGAGFDVLLCNTYHLMLRPGVETVRSQGGLHSFASWSGQILTDSGGFQIYSLGAHCDEEGAEFRSVYDGSTHRLSPEGAVDVQAGLGGDIQMVLDVCSALPASAESLREAMELTARWAARARRRFGEIGGGERGMALFGIVQGGDDLGLRKKGARSISALDFDGYGIGGLSVGEPPEVRRDALDAAIAELPVDRPRYLMGVGDPVGIVEAVACGVDMFDCVLPTRLARHGSILTSAGRYSLKRAECGRDERPLDVTCTCPVCTRFTRAYLRHLLVVDDPSVQRLATIHNLHFMARLISRVRTAIGEGSIEALAEELRGVFPAREKVTPDV